jgi:HK97 family phage prohead protease
MYSFFSRHEVDKKSKGFSSNDADFPSHGRVAWDAWGGDEGFTWSAKIRDSLKARGALLKGNTMQERDMLAPVVDDVSADSKIYGVDVDSFSDSIMAVDASMDAAQTLLEQYEDKDEIVSQAYYLICAADAALSKVIEALGLVDADDEMNMQEETDAVSTAKIVEQMSSYVELEARKYAIESAERITMNSEVRSVTTEDGSLRIAGYAATFNSEASGLSTREVIAPGAFSRSLASDEPVFLLVNHDTDQLPLASTQSGTLRLSEDEHGLRMEADLDPNNARAVELASALERGDVDKMSFAFSVAPGGDTRAEGLRTLKDLNLFEVSVVTWPAYDSTSVAMRSATSNDIELLELRRRKIALKLALNL